MSKSALRELQHLRQLLEQPLSVPEPGISRRPQRTAEAALQEAQVLSLAPAGRLVAVLKLRLT